MATPRSVFDTLEWDGLGVALWDAVNDVSKEIKGLSTAWKLIITVLRQLKAEKTAAAGAAATLEPDNPLVAFPTFAREFFGEEEPMILSLLSAPLEPELQAQAVVANSNNAEQKPAPAPQPGPESEKTDVHILLLLPALGLPMGCPKVSPEKLTIAAGGFLYPLAASSHHVTHLSLVIVGIQMYNAGIHMQNICTALKNVGCSRENYLNLQP